MGAIVRMHMGEKIRQLFKSELKEADIVVWVDGGVAYVDKNNTNLKVMTIDIDNLSDEFSSNTINKENALEYGVNYE